MHARGATPTPPELKTLNPAVLIVTAFPNDSRIGCACSTRLWIWASEPTPSASFLLHEKTWPGQVCYHGIHMFYCSILLHFPQDPSTKPRAWKSASQGSQLDSKKMRAAKCHLKQELYRWSSPKRRLDPSHFVRCANSQGSVIDRCSNVSADVHTPETYLAEFKPPSRSHLIR